MVKKKIGLASAFSIALLISVCLFFSFCTTKLASNSNAENTAIITQALERASMLCYATEGYYPPNLKYIEDIYGVKIDENKYIVEYSVFASNVKPYIKVIEINTAFGCFKNRLYVQ